MVVLPTEYCKELALHRFIARMIAIKLVHICAQCSDCFLSHYVSDVAKYNHQSCIFVDL